MTDAPRERSFAVFTAACGIEAFALVVVGSSRGRLSRLLVDFELPFSLLTSFALSMILPVFLAILIVATVAVELATKRATLNDTWNTTAISLALVCLAAYVCGVALPLMQLIRGLS